MNKEINKKPLRPSGRIIYENFTGTEKEHYLWERLKKFLIK